MEEETATRSSWQCKPITNPKRLDIDLHFTNKQFLKMKTGLVPEQMEDKWFIFYERGWLNFHRSWTGNGIFKARLTKEKGGYCINELWAESHKGKNEGDVDDHDRDIFYMLIMWGLLGIDVRGYYSRRHIKTQIDAAQTWSIFGRMYFTQDMYQDDKS